MLLETLCAKFHAFIINGHNRSLLRTLAAALILSDGVVWFAMTDKPRNEGLLLQCIGELNSKWTYYSTFS